MSYIATRSYTSNGTFVAPAGTVLALLQGYGAGGSGASNSGGSSAGGGGAELLQQLVQLVPGTSYNINIGQSTNVATNPYGSLYLSTTSASISIPSANAPLPALTSGLSASVCGFVYATSTTTVANNSFELYGSKYFPGFANPTNNTHITVYFNNTTGVSIQVPTIQPNTWYFFAVTGTYGSASSYLYWGPAGTTPVQYQFTAGTSTSASDIIRYAGAAIGYASSLRYWTTTALTQAQVNQEAASLLPVNTTGLTYHFLDPRAKDIGGLLVDTQGNATAALTNTSCLYSTGVPTNMGSLYLPTTSSFISNPLILPAVSSAGASVSCFVYTATPGTTGAIGVSYYAPGYSVGSYPGFYNYYAATIYVTFNSITYSVYPPTVIQPNTWYFAAVTLTASGSLYLYWGPAGTTPVQLLAKTGLSLTNSVDAPQISTAAPPTYYSSLRYWTTTALIQAQVNAEALSLMPVNTAGLTYHFLSPQSTYLGTSGVVSPGSLLTDAVADGYALTNSSCLYSTFTPPTSQSVLSLPASGNNVKSASTILNPVTGSATTSGFVNMANGGFTTDANGNFPSLGGIVSGVSSLSLPAVTNNIKSATAILPAVTSGGATATGFVDIQSGGVTTDSGGLFPSVTLNSTMTTSALFLPATGNNVTSYSSAILPAISGSASATISGFVYSNTAGITTKYPSTGGKYPGISFTVTSTTITVWFNGLTYTSATVPAISANTWYFFAVTATNGSAPTLYWGTYGSVPTLYLTTGSGTQTSGADYIYIDQNGAGWSYACSFRYWTTKLLTQSQVNQEASSLVPVNTSGLTYHFLNTQSKSISDLTNNSYGAVVTLTNNSCTYSTSGPTSNGTFYVPSNNTTSSSYQIFPSFSNYASMSCFVYIAGSITSSSQDFNMNASYWPYFQTYGYTTVYVYFSVSGFSVTVPTIQPNTWYFGAVTGSPGGIVYLYWGPVGTTPTRYTAGTASSQSTAVSNVTISSFNSIGINCCSLRYWNNVNLTQTLANAEASSLTPVLTTGLIYHFLSPNSTTLSGLLTDTVGTVFYDVLSNPSGAVAATSAPNTLLTGTHEVLSVPPNASVGGGSYMLPVISSGATISCFVYTTYAGQYSIAINNIYYLGIYINSSTQIQVGFNGTTFYQTVPTIQPNTWYFAAVTVTIGGNLYLYWGPANGSAPTQYLLSTVGSSPGTSLGTSTFASAANNTAYYCSARFWANTALTSTQINQEAVSIVPVNTTGLSYHFLNPSALNITGLLTDTVGATQQIYSTNTQYAQQTPLNTITPTQALVYFDGYAYITTIPAVQANTWYFYAVTGTVGGNVYLYLGQVGTTPTQYLCTSSAVAGTTGTDYVYFDQTSTGSSYAGSLRYWGAAALTQGQVNAEAASIIPVTSGLSYHFLNPQATSLTSLLTDTVGGSQVLANSSCTIISGAPPISPTLAVNFNGITYTASNIPAILANTWYFYAISATSGSNPTLYWGPAGTTPIAYSTTGSGTQASGADYVYFDQSSSGQSYACSLRYWNATGLTSSQIIQEASSLTPYNTTGLTYHFLSPNSSSITGLLTDTVGNTTTPLVNTGSQYDATIDLPATFIPPNVGALYLPSPGYNVGYNGATGTSLSAVTSAATISGFVYSTSGAGITTKYSLSFGYFPGISYTQGSSTINVYFNKLSDGYASLPAPAANTWYFFAVTAVSGGSVYLYWGQVGSAPAQYGPLTMSGTASSGTDYVYIDQNGGTGSSYACSFRYWNGVALSATQVNQEAASLLPVNTSGLTYHFLDPRSTNIAGAGAAGSLLNDTWGNGGYLANNSCAYSTGVPTTKGALYIPASGNNVISGTAILPSVVSASAAGFIYLTGSAAVTTTSQSRYPSIFTPAPGGTSVNIYMNGVSQGSGVTLSTGVVANTWYFFAITGTTGGSIYFYWGPAGTIPIQYLVTSSATGIAQADSVYVRQSGTGISYVSSLRYWTTSALTQAQINAEALSLTPVITPTHHYLSPSSTSLGTSGTASANTLITDTINPANNTYALTYTASTVQYSTQVPNITVPTLSTGIIPVEPQVNPTTGSSSTTFMNGGTTLCSFMGAANASGISGGQDAAVISTTYDDYAPQTGGDTANGYVGMAGRTDGYTGGAAGAASGFSQGGGGAGPGSAGAAGGVIGASALANTGAGGGGGAVSAGQGGSGLANLTWWPGMASKTFLANGSWTAPAGYAGPVVCVGCGGGGGSATSSTAGGGGATLQYGMFQATPNQVYTVTVGAGGTSGATAGGVTKIVNNNGAVQVYGAIGGGGSSGSNPGRNNPVSSTSITTPDASSGGNASTAGNTGYDNTYAGGAAVSTTGGGGAGPYGAGASGGQSAAANTGAGAGAGGYTGGSGQVTIYWWPDGGAACEVFNSNGTFVCPSGVTKILLWGFGGGGGGSTGLTAGTVSSNSGGYGGGGSTASLVAVNVTPGASYVVTIGAGGAGGLSTYKNPNWKIANGSPGLATSFGSLASFMGGGEGGFDGGSSDTTHPNSGKFTQGNSNIVGWGGGRASGTFYGPGNISWQGYGGGAAGANNVYTGGFGGGGGPVGAGGSGGAGAANSSSAGSAGISAAANTGAGGGGGGGQLNTLTSIQYGSGGNGGSGQLIVCWWI